MTSIGNGGIHPDNSNWKKFDPQKKAPPEKANAEDGVGKEPKELKEFKMDLQRSKKN